MKKVKKSTAKSTAKKKVRTTKKAASTHRVARKRIATQRRSPRRPARKVTTTKRPGEAVSSQHASSAAKMAASVMSRRAAKIEAAAAPRLVVPERPPLKLEPRIPSSSRGRSGKAGAGRSGRGHGGAGVPGNRPVVRVSRVPQFNYMKAPGSANGFDVGDTVEVYCDHELNGERVRGWVKGVVVQVDNKLVAVQFRSNVFLTDGWMVPDRILWYSLGSDQIRAAGIGKKSPRAVVPEY